MWRHLQSDIFIEEVQGEGKGGSSLAQFAIGFVFE